MQATARMASVVRSTLPARHRLIRNVDMAPNSMTRRDPSELAFENASVLDLVQALIGCVSANLRAVTIEVVQERVRLHFLLAEESTTNREEFDNIIFEFEASQECLNVVADVRVLVSPEAVALTLLPGRRIFGRKEGDHQIPTE